MCSYTCLPPSLLHTSEKNFVDTAASCAEPINTQLCHGLSPWRETKSGVFTVVYMYEAFYHPCLVATRHLVSKVGKTIKDYFEWVMFMHAHNLCVLDMLQGKDNQFVGEVELAHNAQSRLITSLPSTLEYLNIYWLNVNVIHYCGFIWCSSHTWPLTWARICIYVHWKCNQKLCQWTWEC